MDLWQIISDPPSNRLCVVFFLNHQKAKQICLTNSCKNQHKADSKGDPILAVTDPSSVSKAQPSHSAAVFSSSLLPPSMPLPCPSPCRHHRHSPPLAAAIAALPLPRRRHCRRNHRREATEVCREEEESSSLCILTNLPRRAANASRRS